MSSPSAPHNSVEISASAVSSPTSQTGSLLAENPQSMRKWFIHRIDARNSPNNYVLAAGGVVWRRNEKGDIEVLLEHRKRYDDWSIPKGKVDPGESLVMTAIREIAEETGFDVRLGKFLKRVHYPLSGDRQKIVYYWCRLLVENSTSIAKWTALRGLHFPKLNNRFNMSLIAKSYAVSGK